MSKKKELTEEQKEARRKAVRAFVTRNPGFASAKKKRYNKRNPEKVREKRLLKRYNINNQQFADMATKQGNACAICNQFTAEPTKELVVDHCHATGKIRGLLCNHCNQGIGLLKENITIMKAAIVYLEFWEKKD